MKIEFIPTSKEYELVASMPKPAKTYIPDWYKEIPSTKNIEFVDGDIINDYGSIKRCMPFLDSLTSGYIQETWTDIHIKKNGDNIIFNYSVKPFPMQIREHKASKISDRYYQAEFTWKIPWVPKLPKGYSAIFAHPFNRIDLPFFTTTGVVDSDVFFHTGEHSGNYPFYIEKDFEGIIPAGTPMYQIIPVKRENWKSSAVPFNLDDSIRRERMLKRHFMNNYKKQFWQRKNYD